MKKVIVLLLFAQMLLAEPSVYSDSDFIDSDALVKKNTQQILFLKQKINQLKEQVEGLKTVINGLESEINMLRQKVNGINYEKIINQLSQRVATLESKSLQAQTYKEKVSFDKVSQITKQDVKKEKKSEKEKNTVKKSKKDITKLSNKKLYKEAVLDFTKSKLESAKRKFLELQKREFKKAAVKFYLGEIAYRQNLFKKAISYYQESVTLNENAAYMDKLLLHTALALYKMGRKEEAKNFFDAVIEQYPESASAKVAKKYLKK